MSSNNNNSKNKKSNAIKDAYDFTLVSSYVTFRDMQAKIKNPNTHYNPETDTVEPGA